MRIRVGRRWGATLAAALMLPVATLSGAACKGSDDAVGGGTTGTTDAAATTAGDGGTTGVDAGTTGPADLGTTGTDPGSTGTDPGGTGADPGGTTGVDVADTSDTPEVTAPPKGSGKVTTATATGKNFSALDAALSPDGKSLYFTATMADGLGTALYLVDMAEPNVTVPLAKGFVHATGIAVSANGKSVYVADLGAEEVTTGKLGVIYDVTAIGGASKAIDATWGYQPRALDIGKTIMFAGTDPADGKAGIFEIDGPTVSLTVKDDLLREPSGLAAAANNTLYVADSVGGPGRRGALYVLEKGKAATSLKTTGAAFWLGHPAGVALSQDEAFLLVSGRDPASGALGIYRIALASGTTEVFKDGLGTGTEPGGLHRALDGDMYAFVSAGDAATGSVFLVK